MATSDALMSIVHSLMCHLQHGESESFSKRAIESLVKKLKDKRDELDALITAVTTNGAHPTKCVTIQRTLDGRLQVAGRKGFPHVIYARLWRWPDLHKNELKHLKFCQFAFDLKNELVCVNPFHYERVISTNLDITSLSILPRLGIPSNNHPRSNGQLIHFLPPPQQLTNQFHISNSSELHYSQRQQSNSLNDIKYSNHIFLSSTSSSSATKTTSHNNLSDFAHNGSGEQCWTSQDSKLIDQKIVDSENSHLLCHSPPMPSITNKPQSTLFHENECCEDYISSSPQFHHQSINSNFFTSSWDSFMHQSNNQLEYKLAPEINNIGDGNSHHMLEINHRLFEALRNHPAPEFWCSISYFELTTQVGEMFRTPSSFNYAVIDGYTDVSSDGSRFCLGALTNVNRTEASEKARLHIGKGVRLDMSPDELEIWVECLSEHAVFVQSLYLDREAGRCFADAVHKIYPHSYIKVFDLRQFYCHILYRLCNYSNARMQSSSSQSNEIDGINVDTLRQLCCLRLSFVKGWGCEYPRDRIEQTPCWIEIQLHRALQLLDGALHSAALQSHQMLTNEEYMDEDNPPSENENHSSEKDLFEHSVASMFNHHSTVATAATSCNMVSK